MDISQLIMTRLVSENSEGRDFIAADLHGCYDALMHSLDEVGFDRQCDRLFTLGDMVDRGEGSYDILRLLEEPWFYSVLGNHEYLMLSALRDGAESSSWRAWMNNGGWWFSTLNPDQHQIVAELLPQVARLPLTLTVQLDSGKRVGLSHAQPPSYRWDAFVNGMRAGAPSSEKQIVEKQVWRTLWGRDIIRSRIVARVRDVDATFHGHTIVSSPVVLGNMHFIDTGAYLENRVHLIELNDQLLSAGNRAA